MEAGSVRAWVVGLLVVGVAVVGYFLYTGGYLNDKGITAGKPVLPDSSRLGFLADENGTTVGYLGTADGAVKKLPALPQGESLVAVARGGQKVFVLAESSSGGNTIYEYVGNAFEPRFSGAGLARFLEVSPDGTQVGFVSEESGGSRAYIFTLDSTVPVPQDVGPADQIRFFTHEETPGLWIIDGNTLSIRLMTDGEWSEPETVFEGEMPITGFAGNGAGRFLYIDAAKNATEEMSIDSIMPFAASTRGTYATAPYAVFFWGNDFYSLSFKSGEEDAGIRHVAVAPLSRPDEQTIYPIEEVIPKVQAVFPLNP